MSCSVGSSSSFSTISRVTSSTRARGLRRQAGQLAFEPLQLGSPDAHRTARRSATIVGTAPRERCHARELRHFLGDDRFGALDLRAAARQVLLHDRLQVVDVVEEHLLDVADRCLDVARHGDVDDEQRIAPMPAGHRLDLRARDDRPLRSGRRDDDVGVGERRAPSRPTGTRRPPTDAASASACAAVRLVIDDLADALRCAGAARSAC